MISDKEKQKRPLVGRVTRLVSVLSMLKCARACKKLGEQDKGRKQIGVRAQSWEKFQNEEEESDGEGRLVR